MRKQKLTATWLRKQPEFWMIAGGLELALFSAFLILGGLW